LLLLPFEHLPQSAWRFAAIAFAIQVPFGNPVVDGHWNDERKQDS
jgi:hypothetical protein